MKNRIFSIILAIFLMLPVYVQAVEEKPQMADEVLSTEGVEQVQLLDEDIKENNADIADELQYKEPISKRKLFKKFLLAMFAVLISSFALYSGLTVYNRVRNNFAKKVNTPDGEISLETPDDLNSAVRTFLEKTKWN